MGISPRLADAIAAEVPGHRRDAGVARRLRGVEPRPVLLFLAPRAVRVDEVWIAVDSWHALRRRLLSAGHESVAHRDE
jgi:hypothetical protein